jgi:hypothetical protein
MSCNNVTYKVIILNILLLLYKYALVKTLLGPLNLKMKPKHYCLESVKMYLTSQEQQHCGEKLKFRSNNEYLNSRYLKFTVI